jgi:hypothetical protein
LITSKKTKTFGLSTNGFEEQREELDDKLHERCVTSSSIASWLSSMTKTELEDVAIPIDVERSFSFELASAETLFEQRLLIRTDDLDPFALTYRSRSLGKAGGHVPKRTEELSRFQPCLPSNNYGGKYEVDALQPYRTEVP